MEFKPERRRKTVLQEIELTFEVTQQGIRKGNLDEAMHGWLFHRLKEKNPTLADEIHALQVKPFSIHSTSHSTSRKSKEMLEGQSVTTSLSVFAPKYSSEMLDLCANVLHREYQIGKVPMYLKNMSLKRSQTYEEIMEEAFGAEYSRVSLTFSTPTSFRSEGIQILFPTPDLVLQSLYNRWKTFSPIKMEDVDANWGSMFVVSRYQLQTKPVGFDRYQVMGCVGNIQYSRISSSNYYLSRFAYALFHFGTFTGVGYKSTMGLGRMRVSYS
jgi:CRISPR-associated endoribonuclease Cas6